MSGFSYLELNYFDFLLFYLYVISALLKEVYI